MSKKAKFTVLPTRQIFLPAQGWILVRPVPEVTEINGIALPQSSAEQPQEAVVLATHDDSVYSVGDVVVHARYAGAPIKLNDEKLLLLKEREEYLGDVLGTKKEKA